MFSDIRFTFGVINSSFVPGDKRCVGLVLDGWAVIADFEIIARDEEGCLQRLKPAVLITGFGLREIGERR